MLCCPIFGLWVKDLALLDLKFEFSMRKSSYGTPPELIWLDSDDIERHQINKIIVLR